MGARLGAFELQERIGDGGMASVYRAIHPETRVQAAIKVLTGEAGQADGPMRALRREARAVARLHHPGVVMVLDTGVVGEGVQDLRPGSPWLAMEYASGGTLTDLGRLPWPDLRAVLLGILDALGHAHARGLVHRDLKPGNVLLCTERDSRPGLKLSDFGIATAIDWHVRSGSLVVVAGTLHYMAPEQLLGNWRDYGPWTDLYALGCMAWKLSTGRLPFFGKGGPTLMRAQLLEDPPAFVPIHPVPKGFEAWLRRLMSKSPADRFAFAMDAAWALAEMELEEDVAASGRFKRHGDAGEGTGIFTAAVDSGPASPPRSAFPAGATRPPVPRSWRHRNVPVLPPRLVGAGRGLVGLRQVAMVGREDARDRLWAGLLDALESGAPRVIVVEGGSGVGKTRLGEWFSARASEVGAARAVKMVFRADEDAPRAARRALSRTLAVQHLDPEDRVERLEDLFDESGAWVEDLSAMLGADEVSPAAYGPIVEALERYSAVRPLIVWLEDVHARADAYNVAERLAERFDGAVLVLATRVGTEPRWTDLADQVVRLPPLKMSELGDLVRRHLPVERGLLQDLCGRAAGNPAFALALMSGWLQDDRLALTPRGYRLEGPIEDVDDLSSAFDDRVQALLDGLPESAGIALERLAVAGMPLTLAEWVELGADAAQVEVLTDRLLAAGRATLGTQLEIDGGLFRECLLERASRARRLQGHHRAVAERMAERGVPTARLGHHLAAAGRVAKAIDTWTQAAERALSNTEPGLALTLVDRLELRLPEADPRRIHMEVIRIEALWRVGRHRLAYARSGPLLTELRRRDASELAGRVALLHGRILAARGEIDRAGRVLAELDMPEARIALAFALAGVGRTEEAVAELTGLTDPVSAALRAECRIGDLDVALDALPDRWVLAAILARSADGPELETRLWRAVEIQDAIDPALAAPTRVRLAMTLVHRGAHAEAGRQVGLARQPGNLDRAGRVLCQGIDLVARAADGRWPRFDLSLRAVAKNLSSHGSSDIAACLECAGALAADAKVRDRASNAYRLARGVYRQLGDATGVARVDGCLRTLAARR